MPDWSATHAPGMTFCHLGVESGEGRSRKRLMSYAAHGSVALNMLTPICFSGAHESIPCQTIGSVVHNGRIVEVVVRGVRLEAILGQPKGLPSTVQMKSAASAICWCQ